MVYTNKETIVKIFEEISSPVNEPLAVLSNGVIPAVDSLIQLRLSSNSADNTLVKVKSIDYIIDGSDLGFNTTTIVNVYVTKLLK